MSAATVVPGCRLLHAILQSHGPGVLRRAMERVEGHKYLVPFTWRDVCNRG